MKQSQSPQSQTQQMGEDQTTAEQHRSAPAVQGAQASGPAARPVEPKFDPGSGAEETPEGLDAEAEAVRRAAEEEPPVSASDERVPVFDRANLSERI
jgi:hypothetical protein